MPLMVRDGTLNPTTATEWATANYIGYLIGALVASRFRHQPIWGLKIGLLGVCFTTIGMIGVSDAYALGGLILRGSAGVFSAWVMVCASGWCLPELARQGASSLGGWIYTGVGLGIAVTGVMSWLGGNQTAMALWIELGLIAMAGAIFVLLTTKSEATSLQKIEAPVNETEGLYISSIRKNRGLIFCYSAFGFGYIIPATYLPMMAKQLVEAPLVFGLTWPIFGAAAALSVAMVTRWLVKRPRQKIWAIAQAVMALGTLLPIVHESLWILSLSAVLVGGTFMVTTMAGLQLARERMPANPTPLLAQMTAAFAGGQIAGPLFIWMIGAESFFGLNALNLANAVSTVLLVSTSVWLWREADHKN
jgi:hypothetical protein